MHKLFADWYRQADLNASAELLAVRWACVEAALKKLDVGAIVELTRVNFSLPAPDPAGPHADGATVAQTFKEADISFPMKGNAQLLRVLFGVTLAQVIETNHSLATFAALAVTSASCSGLVAAPCVDELVPIAAQYLAREATAKRTTALETAATALKFEKLDLRQAGQVEIFETPNQNHWAQVHQNFQNLKVWVGQVNAAIEALAGGLGATRTQIGTALNANTRTAALDNRIKVLKEEADVLWWLFGEYSPSLTKAWRGGEAGEFCVALGRELARLLVFYEPPSNTESFLSKALSGMARGSDLLSVKQLLDGGSPTWRHDVVTAARACVQRSGAVTPVHAGLVAREDFSSRWVERLAEIGVLKPEQQMTPVKWAIQACYEALLLDWME